METCCPWWSPYRVPKAATRKYKVDRVAVCSKQASAWFGLIVFSQTLSSTSRCETLSQFLYK